MAQVAVAGLGAMGTPIALNLLSVGQQVAVWSRDQRKVDSLAAQGAQVIVDPADLFTSPVLLSVLADDQAVREVFLGGDLLQHAPAGAVHANLATISPALAQQAAVAHAEHGVGYVAAPMFGGITVAQAGRLNIVAAGPAHDLELARPALESISARVWPVGEQAHLANVVKLAGQIVIGSAIQALSEAVSLVEHDGIDARLLIELFTATITPGPVYTNYGNLIANQRYEPAGFTAPLGRKDIDLARNHAEHNGLQLPVADLLSALLASVIDSGGFNWDWAALAHLQRGRRTTAIL